MSSLHKRRPPVALADQGAGHAFAAFQRFIVNPGETFQVLARIPAEIPAAFAQRAELLRSFLHHRSQQFLLRFEMPEQRHLIATRPLGDPTGGGGFDPFVAEFRPRGLHQPLARAGFLGCCGF